MSRLTMRLFGGFEVLAGSGRSLAVPTRKAQALLAYLALTPGQAHPRDKLASLLWGNTIDTTARTLQLDWGDDPAEEGDIAFKRAQGR